MVADYGSFDSATTMRPLLPPNPGVSSDDTPVVPTLGQRWISYAYWQRPPGQAIKADSATWTVPQPPSTWDGQTIFLFNGIGTWTTILQPVLQWGPSAADTVLPAHWSAACWYAYGNSAFWTPVIQVVPGDQLLGAVDSGASGTYTCSVSSPGKGYYQATLSDVGEQPIAFETLEAYSLYQCSDYPNADSMAFRSISIVTHAGIPTLKWVLDDTITDCNQHTVIARAANPGGEIDVYFRNPPPPPLTTGISGPSAISTKGSYTWTATPGGGTGFYTYQWWQHMDGGTRYTLGTQQSQSVTVSAGPNFWMVVTVVSGPASVSDSVYVTDCIGLTGGCVPQ